MGKISKKVQVVVFMKNSENSIKTLLLKTNVKRGSFWQNVTGSVEEGEEYYDAARRELLEETGIDAEVFELKYQISFFDRWKKDVVEKCYYTITNKTEIILDPNEHIKYEWIDLNEVSKESYFFETNFKCFSEAKECLK